LDSSNLFLFYIFCWILLSAVYNMYWPKLTTASSMGKMQMWRLRILIPRKMSSEYPSTAPFFCILFYLDMMVCEAHSHC